MSWTLVYQNDSAGNRVGGDIGTLIRAVRRGSTVKVVFESESAFPPLEGGPYVYTFQAHPVHIRNSIAFATCTLDVSSFFKGNQLKFQDDSGSPARQITRSLSSAGERLQRMLDSDTRSMTRLGPASAGDQPALST